MAASLSPLRKKARLIGACLRGRPVWCSWQLTPRCGAHCAFCEHRASGGVAEATTAEALAIAEGLDRVGSMVISLSGGEPFLREDLSGVVSALSANHFVLLTTHGFLVTDARSRSVWESGLDGASVLFEDADPDRHDALAGVPGAFSRAVAAAQSLLRSRTRPDQQVNLKTRVRGADRESHVPRLLDLAERLGATLSVEAEFPVARGTGRGGVAAALLELKKKRPALRTKASVLARLDEAFEKGVPGCLAAKAFLNVDELGRVSRCPEIRPPGEVIADLRRPGGDWLRALEAVHRSNTCQKCWSGARGEVEAVYSIRGIVSLLPGLLRS